MIDKTSAPEALAMLGYELDDAAEALATLLREMKAEDFGEPEFRVNLGHVYAHLNRAWHMRNATTDAALDPSEEQREAWTQFPTDLEPVG